MAKRPKKIDVITTSSNSVKYSDIQSLILLHNDRVGPMIKRHLDEVTKSTGHLLSVDVQYVINLSNRELGHAIKKLYE